MKRKQRYPKIVLQLAILLVFSTSAPLPAGGQVDTVLMVHGLGETGYWFDYLAAHVEDYYDVSVRWTHPHVQCERWVVSDRFIERQLFVRSATCRVGVLPDGPLGGWEYVRRDLAGRRTDRFCAVCRWL